MSFSQLVLNNFEFIKDWVRNIKYFLRNIYVFRNDLWYWREWDQAYIYDFNATMYERMWKSFENYSYHVGKEKDIKELKIISELYKRLSEDDVILPQHVELLKDWWDSRREEEHGEFIEMVFPNYTPSKRRLFKTLHEREEKIKENYKDLLYKYLKRKHYWC